MSKPLLTVQRWDFNVLIGKNDETETSFFLSFYIQFLLLFYQCATSHD